MKKYSKPIFEIENIEINDILEASGSFGEGVDYDAEAGDIGGAVDIFK